MELKRIKEEINRLETYKADNSITDSGLELLAELKHTTKLVKNINYDAVLAVVIPNKKIERAACEEVQNEDCASIAIKNRD